MITSWLIHMGLNAVGFPVSINDVCVFVPAGFAIVTCLFMYLLTKEVSGSANAGVVAAAIMAIIPAHMMRSVAGGYDNEAVAVPLIVATLWAWTRSLRTSQSWPFGILTGLLYVYLVATWGAYTFVLNLIGIHAGVLVLLGRYSDNLHHSYSLFWPIGTLGALQFPIVGWRPISSLEEIGPMVLFIGFQVWWYIERSRSKLTFRQFLAYRIRTLALVGSIALGITAFLIQIGYFGAFSNRVRSLFIPHTRTGNPLVDSVAEHAATDPEAFMAYFHQVYYMSFVGFFMLFLKISDASIFGIVYSALAFYFSKKMVRLILLLSPPASMCAGMFIWWVIDFSYKYFMGAREEKEGEGEKKKPSFLSSFLSVVYTYGGLVISTLLLLYVMWAAFGFATHSYEMAEHLSQPQVILSSRTRDGRTVIIDDFREGYWWLRDNTPQDARVMAWWDYGYQINGIANRTSIADGNTWNFEHIAMLGKCLLSKEKEVTHFIWRRPLLLRPLLFSLCLLDSLFLLSFSSPTCLPLLHLLLSLSISFSFLLLLFLFLLRLFFLLFLA